jgi:hypothetical protein
MLLADFAEYIKAHERVNELYKVKNRKRLKIRFIRLILESN